MTTISVDPTLDLFAEIARLKEQRRAVILAHYYQDPDIQDLADQLGDALDLARKAQSERDAEVILFCGVHFMATPAPPIGCARGRPVIPTISSSATSIAPRRPRRSRT